MLESEIKKILSLHLLKDLGLLDPLKGQGEGGVELFDAIVVGGFEFLEDLGRVDLGGDLEKLHLNIV